MSQLRSTIERLASQFAVSVLAALRSASLDELADVVSIRSGSSASSAAPARRGRPPRAAAAAPASSAAAPAKRGRRRLGRRTQKDITRMVEAIVGALAKSSSGMRSEQLRAALGVQSKELPRPLAEALSSGRVTKTGQKRATTYFAGGSAARASAGGAKAGGAKAGAAKAGGAKRRGRRVGSKNK
jgi:hypothetical protein